MSAIIVVFSAAEIFYLIIVAKISDLDLIEFVICSRPSNLKRKRNPTKICEIFLINSI